jgi:hypothetical protein
MEAKTVDEEELLLLISEPTNKNGFEILSKLKKGARNNHQFEQELRKIFPQSNSGNGNIMKAVDKFLKEYENKKNTTILRINRANAESIFANENGKRVCKLCSEIKKTAKERKSHYEKKHLKTDDVSAQIENDEELVNYTTSPFILQGLNYERPRFFVQKSKQDLIISNNKKQVIIDNLHEQVKSLDSEKRATIVRSHIVEVEVEVLREKNTRLEEDLEILNREESEESDYENMEEDCEAGESTKEKTFVLPQDKECYVIDRKSSKTEHGLHATKVTHCPKVSRYFVLRGFHSLVFCFDV